MVLDPAGSFQDAEVMEDLPAANFELHVLTTQTDHHLAKRLAGRCAARGGRLQIVSSPEDAARYLANLNRSWQADYEIAFATGTEVKTVELFSESGSGVYSSGDTRDSGMVGAQGLEPRASSV